MICENGTFRRHLALFCWQPPENHDCLVIDHADQHQASIKEMDFIASNSGLEHLIEEILGNLDRNSLSKCRVLSKRFKAIIDGRKSLIFLQWKQMSGKIFVFPDAQQCSIIDKFRGKWPETFGGFQNLEDIEEMKELLEFMRQFCNHIQSAKVRPQNDLDLDYDLEYKKTPAHFAMRQNRIKILSLLRKCGCDLNASNGDLLQVACANGFSDVVDYLLSLPEIDANASDTYLPPLHLACKYGHLEIVKLFLQYASLKKIDLNQRIRHQTPLHTACENGQKEVVSLLLEQSEEKGICVRAIDDIGRNALFFACSSNNGELVKMLLENNFNQKAETSLGTRTTPFHYACSMGNIEVIKVMLENAETYSIDLNAKNREGRTPIFFACRDKQSEATLYLIENYQKYGIDLNIRDVNGWNLLHMACLKGLYEVTRLLLSKLEELGIDQFAESKNDSSALHFAAYGGNANIVSLLLQNGFDINSKGYNGETPLHIACKTGRINVIKMLLEKAKQKKIRIDFNATNVFGDTPLHVAQDKVIKALLSNAMTYYNLHT